MTDFEPMLDSRQAAALLKIHPKTLQKMAREGRIPAFRIGDLWRFRASDLDQHRRYWTRAGFKRVNGTDYSALCPGSKRPSLKRIAAGIQETCAADE